MPYIVLSQELAFQKTDPDRPTIPVGPEEIVERGGSVPDYVPAYIISALSNAGVIVWAEDRNPLIVPASQAPAQVRTPDHPAVLPSDPNGTPLLLGDLTGTSVEEAPAEEPVEEEGDGEPVALPATSDKKEVWEAYAQRPEIGLTAGEAESMNKTDLMAEVRARFDQAHQ
jgi:hypothetical protein